MALYSEGRMTRKGFQAFPTFNATIRRMQNRMRPATAAAEGDEGRYREEEAEKLRRWEYEQRRGLFESIFPKIDWSDPAAIESAKRFIKEFEPTAALAAAPPTAPVSPRRARLIQKAQARHRAVRAGQARRAPQAAAQAAEREEVGQRKQEGTWTPGIFRTPEGRALPEEAMAVPPGFRERLRVDEDLGARREAIGRQRREVATVGREAREAMRGAREPEPTLPLVKPDVDPVKALRADAAKNALEAKRKGEPIPEVDRDILGLQDKTPDEKQEIVNESLKAYREGAADELQTKIAEKSLGIAEPVKPIDAVKELEGDAVRVVRAAVQAGEDVPEWARDVLKLRDRTPDEKQEVVNASIKALGAGDATEFQTRVAEKALGIAERDDLSWKTKELYAAWVSALSKGWADQAKSIANELDRETPGWRKTLPTPPAGIGPGSWGQDAEGNWYWVPAEGGTPIPATGPSPTAGSQVAPERPAPPVTPAVPERYESASDDQIRDALQEANGDLEKTERLLNAKGLTGND